MNTQAKEILRHLESAHREEIETITQILAKITNHTPEQIKPHLDAMLERLVKHQQERPFYKTATPEEWSRALREWSDSHDRNTPLLSDEAVSRRGIYEED